MDNQQQNNQTQTTSEDNEEKLESLTQELDHKSKECEALLGKMSELEEQIGLQAVEIERLEKSKIEQQPNPEEEKHNDVDAAEFDC